MQYIKSYRTGSFIFLTIILMAISGCGKARSNAIVDPNTGQHASSWIDKHGDSFLNNASVCYKCHGDDLQGGISKVGCFSDSFDGTACHGALAFHGAGWDSPDAHGASAKAKPGKVSGFQACRTCHGSDFTGGIMRISCYTSGCHDTGMPHAAAPWDGINTSRTHTNTDWENGTVCAVCHAGESSTPAPAGTPVNCFNNTLCHGNVHHPDTWVTDHAIQARSDNSSCATSSCHGTDYKGGSVGIGCYDCHLGGPNASSAIMHPNLWADPEESHPDYLESRGKNASSCSPSWPGVAQYCHGDGLPKDSSLLAAPPNGSWPEGPTCYHCHGKRWSAP